MTRLASEPGTHTSASVNDWAYPFTRLEEMVASLWDAAAPHTYRKPKPHPRPYPEIKPKEHHGNVASRTPEQVKAILRQFGPGPYQAPV